MTGQDGFGSALVDGRRRGGCARRAVGVGVPGVIGFGFALVLMAVFSTLEGCDFDLSFGPEDCWETDEELLRLAWHDESRDLAEELEDGADPDVRDDDGRTPLYCAARGGSRRSVEVLLDAGAEPDTANAAGDTPLLWAAHEDHADVVEVLLEADADPSIRTDAGHTPLFRAVAEGSEDAVDALLDGGADPDESVAVGLGQVVLRVAEGLPRTTSPATHRAQPMGWRTRPVTAG
ncbi:MAG: ankyrin repeat domain-containing protein [Acidimicrobiia bacterium]|nr:ankyrin repeat domain-containing protein [Acidimicrobiia bacterium]